ncbi:MAG TPA: M14 family zinc carboxypeptidase, partial [Pyrinomonadaceae bacterium]|nr:M14 family zinc carboxypeptidase [Pyrinomonadaceae bacterium]
MKREVRTSLLAALCVLTLASLLLQPFGRVAGAPQQRPSAAEHLIARVTVRDRQELERFARLGLDLLETRDGDDLFILTSEAEVARLRAEGWRVRVDERQTALVRSQRPELRQTRARTGETSAAASGTNEVSASSFMGGYLTVPEMRAFVEDRAARFPDLAEFLVYGQSWERINKGPSFGHELFGIRLTNKLRPSHDGTPKPTFVLVAAIHARELSTSELALRFVDHLLNGYGTDADATWL